MLTIDGSLGEGGGQILRTSLALSAITGTPITIEKIRAKRPKPGLQRQHLMAVRAAARVCGAELSGDELNSRAITFRPQPAMAGEYHVPIGSAGSCSLVLQTVLPVLMTADKTSRVVIEGGTHNPLAPPFEFLRDAFLPQVARIGAEVTLTLDRHGFYPAGGGRLIAQIEPLTKREPFSLLERGKSQRRGARCQVANLPITIAEREAVTVKHKLKWSEDDCRAESIHACDGPGNIVLITLAYEHVTEVVARCGEMRVSAEVVAARAAQDARRYLEATAPVGEHLADQLLLPLVLAAGGEFRTVRPSEHFTTNAAVIAQFLGERVTTRELGPDDWLVTVRRR
ncbi:MAG: RNA 3'-terminal phosphate cyclase [Planctomycetes bacterium]|nr:RNA 3'-terminal phosphate cyclase [Planctomycetota bacterium]